MQHPFSTPKERPDGLDAQRPGFTSWFLLTATAVGAQNNQVGRPFFVNTGGFDGKQARTRHQIDELKKRGPGSSQSETRCPKIIPNEHGIKSVWPYIGERLTAAGANMNYATISLSMARLMVSHLARARP